MLQFKFTLKKDKRDAAAKKRQEEIQEKNIQRFVDANYGQPLDQAVLQQLLISKEKYLSH